MSGQQWVSYARKIKQDYGRRLTLRLRTCLLFCWFFTEVIAGCCDKSKEQLQLLQPARPYMIHTVLFQDNHHACDGGHITGQEVAPQQPVQASHHGEVKLALHLPCGSNGRDRADLWAGTDFAARCARLWHHQSPVAARQDLTRSNRRLSQDIFP